MVAFLRVLMRWKVIVSLNCFPEVSQASCLQTWHQKRNKTTFCSTKHAESASRSSASLLCFCYVSAETRSCCSSYGKVRLTIHSFSSISQASNLIPLAVRSRFKRIYRSWMCRRATAGTSSKNLSGLVRLHAEK
jgi:hypothetical protein